MRVCEAGALLARIHRASGEFPTLWHEFREYGPLDARFDPHPLPCAETRGAGVMYAVLEPSPGDATSADGADEGAPSGLESAFATCLLEVFQQHRMIRRSAGAPTLAAWEMTRPLHLLDLSDSDWIAVAGGNSAISSGDREHSRAWARAIRERYPELDGVVAASSLVPSARIVALFEPARDALPMHPLAQLRLDAPVLTALIDRIAERYGYLVF